MNISIILITYNEAHTVKRALQSVYDLSDDIIVVDSHSTDQTREICKQFTDKVYCETWKGYAEQKNSAILKTKYDWILWLDADEELICESKDVLKTAISTPKYVGFKLKRRTQFLGRWMDHCWGNDWVVRLFKKSAHANFPAIDVHESLAIQGEVGRLKTALLWHYPYPTISVYFQKFVSYAVLSTEANIKKGKKGSLWRASVAFPITFFKLYILKCGFLDGIPGLILILFSSFHNFVKYVMLWERTKK